MNKVITVVATAALTAHTFSHGREHPHIHQESPIWPQISNMAIGTSTSTAAHFRQPLGTSWSS